MKLKKSIYRDTLKILKDKEVPNELISKIIMKLVNYTYDSMSSDKPAAAEGEGK